MYSQATVVYASVIVSYCSRFDPTAEREQLLWGAGALPRSLEEFLKIYRERVLPQTAFRMTFGLFLVFCEMAAADGR